MSVAPDMLYHMGGVPVAGTIPITKTSSVYYFVDSLTGSDDYSGLSHDRPKATIAAAITLSNARVDWTDTEYATGDVIVVSPGQYAENLTSLPYGGTIVGLGDSLFCKGGYGGVSIMPATGAAVDVTSALDCTIRNVAFKQIATAGAIFQADNFNQCWLDHCFFEGIVGASPSTTRGFEVVKDMTKSKLTNCTFTLCKTGIYINTDNVNEKSINSSLFENIRIQFADVAGFHFDTNCNATMTLVNNCNVGDNSETLALGMDDDSDQVTVANSNFWATNCDPADGGSYYCNCYLNGVLLN